MDKYSFFVHPFICSWCFNVFEVRTHTHTHTHIVVLQPYVGVWCENDLPPLSLSIIAFLQLSTFIVCRSLTISSLHLKLGRPRGLVPVGFWFHTISIRQMSGDRCTWPVHLRRWVFIALIVFGRYLLSVVQDRISSSESFGLNGGAGFVVLREGPCHTP